MPNEQVSAKPKPLLGLCQVKSKDGSDAVTEDGRNEEILGNIARRTTVRPHASAKTVRKEVCENGHTVETAWWKPNAIYHITARKKSRPEFDKFSLETPHAWRSWSQRSQHWETRSKMWTEHHYTTPFLDTFILVHTSHCGSRCRTTWLHKTCSSTCHNMSERLLFPCFAFFLCLSCLYVLSHFYLFSVLNFNSHDVENAEH